MRNQNSQIAYKDLAWFTSNAEIIMKSGMQVFYLQTGRYKIGDGTRNINDLPWLGGVAPSTIVLPAYKYLIGDFDNGTFSNPNTNTQIDLGTFLIPKVDFFQDWLRF